MTIAPVLPFPSAPTWGTAGEVIYAVECRQLGLLCIANSIEARVGQFPLVASHAVGITWSADPDYLTFGGGDNRRYMAWAAEVKGVRFLREHALTFSIPQRSVDGSMLWSASHGGHCVIACVPAGGGTRIATPQQVTAQGTYVDEWRAWRFDASYCPTLAEWAQDPPPYYGGALARLPHPQPVLPLNVRQLPLPQAA